MKPSHPARFAAVVALALQAILATPAVAGGDRTVSLCAEDGTGAALGGSVQVWSEKLQIPPDPSNAFPFGPDGCALVPSLLWDGRPFPLRPWIEIVYRAEAPGHHPLQGRFLVRKGKKDNRVTLLLEPTSAK